MSRIIYTIDLTDLCAELGLKADDLQRVSDGAVGSGLWVGDRLGKYLADCVRAMKRAGRSDVLESIGLDRRVAVDLPWAQVLSLVRLAAQVQLGTSDAVGGGHPGEGVVFSDVCRPHVFSAPQGGNGEKMGKMPEGQP